MDFDVEKLGCGCCRVKDSGNDSDRQLVFLAGPFNGEIWKHQYRYFSGSYRTVVFDCLEGNRSLDRQVGRVEEFLKETDGMNNVVLVSSGPGNRLVQELESREEVVATVITGSGFPGLGSFSSFYSYLSGFVFGQPKLVKKFFFSDSTDYRYVKEFLEDFEVPAREDLETFEGSLRRPVKNSLVLCPESDVFSDRNELRRIGSERMISAIKNTGTFPFYEKPEEFNKAVKDFIDSLEGFVRDRNVERVKRKHRSLDEFRMRRVEA